MREFDYTEVWTNSKLTLWYTAYSCTDYDVDTLD